MTEEAGLSSCAHLPEQEEFLWSGQARLGVTETAAEENVWQIWLQSVLFVNLQSWGISRAWALLLIFFVLRWPQALSVQAVNDLWISVKSDPTLFLISALVLQNKWHRTSSVGLQHHETFKIELLLATCINASQAEWGCMFWFVLF